MKKVSNVFVLLASLTGPIWSSPLLSQSIVFSDATFDPADWQANVYRQDPGTSLGAVTVEPIGGNPGAYQEMTFIWNGGPDAPRRIDLFYKYTADSYNPSLQGAIATIDYSEDGRVTADSHGSPTISLPMRLALEQDGNIYSNLIGMSVIQSPPFPGPWTTVSETGLVAANFPIIFGNGPSRPDFSVNGNDIHFGFIRANSTGVKVREITSAIDNWNLAINLMGQSAGTADLAITKTADNVEVSPGVAGLDLTNFTLTVSNHGPAAADVVVTDLLPVGMDIPPGMAAVASVGSYDASSGEWNVGIIDATEPPTSETLLIPVQVSNPGCITNSATVSTAAGETVTDIIGTNNSDTQIISANPGCVDLELTGSISDAVYQHPVANQLCLDVFVTLTVTNKGPSTVTGIKLRRSGTADSNQDVQHPMLEDSGIFNPALPGNGCFGGVPNIIWDVKYLESDLAPGESELVEVIAIGELKAAGPDIDMAISYFVESDSIDTNPGNDDYIVNTTIVRTGGEGSGSLCFIATAAYGSYLESEVELLRNFRDRILITNKPGRSFVDWYYRNSPTVAKAIAQNDSLRFLTRVALTPLVYAIKYPVPAGLLVAGFVLLLLFKFKWRKNIVI